MSSLLHALRSLAEKTISDCTHQKKVDFSATPVRLLLPSGDEKYYAFWIRDTAMMAESHLISNDDLRRYVELIATYGQNGAEMLYLANGLVVPPYAIADHINYNGKPVFFPGGYKDEGDQGDGTWGSFPPFCDNYYFITMVYDYLCQSDDKAILNRMFSGMQLKERMEKAMEGYNLDEETGLCVSSYARHTVSWGFTDTVAMQGKLLFASMLRYRAAKCMAELFPEKGYASLQICLKNEIIAHFYDEKTGWLWSSDGRDRQHDVWGTAYAVYLRILDESRTIRTAIALQNAWNDGIVGVHGYIRHILTTEDAIPGLSAWARCYKEINTYQNGAYWATPLGWYADAVHLVNPELAESMLWEFITHTKERLNDGAPFEFLSRDGSVVSGCMYGTSGVLPYVAAKRFLEK